MLPNRTPFANGAIGLHIDGLYRKKNSNNKKQSSDAKALRGKICG